MVETQSHITPTQCIVGEAEEALVSSHLLFSEKKALVVLPLLLSESQLSHSPVFPCPRRFLSSFDSFPSS